MKFVELMDLHKPSSRRLLGGPFAGEALGKSGNKPTPTPVRLAKASLLTCSPIVQAQVTRLLPASPPQRHANARSAPLEALGRGAHNACLSCLHGTALAQNVHVAACLCTWLLLFAAFCKRLLLPAAACCCLLPPAAADG